MTFHEKVDVYWKSIILGFPAASFERAFAVELMQNWDLQSYLEEVRYIVEAVGWGAIGSNLGKPMLDCKPIKPNLDIHSKERS